MSYIYEENIKHMREFFESEEYEKRKVDVTAIKNEIKKTYRDPDSCDEKLYIDMRERLNKINDEKYEIKEGKNILVQNTIRCSLDCVIGWKAIIDTYYAEHIFVGNEKEFVEAYDVIRNPKNGGHLVWPSHRNSINVQRYRIFNDRVDYTLFDIKNYFEQKEHKINFDINNTKEWLVSFKGSSGNAFDSFIEKMDLKRWCVKHEEDSEIHGAYGVINIETNEEITKYMPHKKENDKMIRKDYPITKNYIENLLKKVRE